jgi:hypothetical protein
MSARSVCALAAMAAALSLAVAGCGSHTGGKASPRPAAVRSAASPTAHSLLPAPALPDSATPASVLREGLPKFFGASSAWNLSVGASQVDANSGTMLRLAAQRTGVIETSRLAAVSSTPRTIAKGVTINTRAWTVPVASSTAGVPTAVWCRQRQCGTDANGIRSLSIPRDVNPDPRYDGWLTVVDARHQIAYDLWRARRQRDGSISFQYLKRWPLNATGSSQPYVVSARGSGLPLFAGLITRDELQRGAIDHALAISVPGPAQRRFVAPASSTDGVGDVRSLPEGARIRLKASYVLPRHRGRPLSARARNGRRVAEAIVAALQRYGAIVVDRAAVPTLYAQKDVSRAYVRGDELRAIHLSDFDVVPLGHVYPYPKRGS